MSRELRESLQKLQQNGYQIGEPFLHSGSGRVVIKVNQIAVRFPSDVVRLAKGEVTLRQLGAPTENLTQPD